MSDKLFEKGLLALEKAKTILLVDWASPDVPFALIKAGFTVYSYAPDGYSVAGIDIDERPTADGSKSRTEKLVFRHLYRSKPLSVDIVNVFRPEAEHAAIIATHVLPLNARFLWIQPKYSSIKTRNLAFAHGFICIDGVDIAAAAKTVEE